MTAETLLSRLDKVKSTKPGHWLACCPGPLHQRGDRNPSLSITVGDDDRVLVKCFAGCDVAAITAAIGLEMADLFPPRATHYAGPLPRYQRPRIAPGDLLKIVVREACIIALAGDELMAGPLSPPDLERLRIAVRRLFAVMAGSAR